MVRILQRYCVNDLNLNLYISLDSDQKIGQI
jgi:hypothetical protein